MKKRTLFGFIVCLLFIGCQFDNNKNEESEKETYKLTIVWSDYAGIIDENEKVREDDIRIFISDYIYGSKEVKKLEELLNIDSYYNNTDLSKYDSEYKEKMGLGERECEKGSVFIFDAGERYIYDDYNKNAPFVYISSFTYYSDESFADEIKSVVIDSDKTVYVKAYLDYTSAVKWINYVDGGTKSYK